MPLITKAEKKHCHFCGNSLVQRDWEGRVRLFCPICQTPIYENPIPAVCIVVPDKGDGILLVKRAVDPKKGQWCLPGGFMELGETPEDTAHRELKEETGLTGSEFDLLGVVSSPGTFYHTILLVGFHAKEKRGVLSPGDDAQDARYFSINSMPPIAFKSHFGFIKKFMKNPL